MDEGSTMTIIDANIARSVGVEGLCSPINISCINNIQDSNPNSQKVDIGIGALDSSVVYRISNVRTIENLTLFSQTLKEEDTRNIKHLSYLPVEYYTDARPSILLGQDNWNLITNIQTRSNTIGQPAASLTKLGWVIHGRLSSRRKKQINQEVFHIQNPKEEFNNHISDIDLNRLVKFHFTFESIGVTNFKRKNKLEDRAERILESTATYLGDRWEVGLLWKYDDIRLPNNRENAATRLKSLERKMDRDAEYAERYCAQVDHLVTSGYAIISKAENDAKIPSWYLPHFGVVNLKKSKKIRLVFDCAAKTLGICLNDNLLVGPDLTNTLFGVLIRFRRGKIAIKGDIREMFLQVKIRKEDQHVQKFLWRGMDRSKEPDTYIMTSMLFGSASSSYTAQYIMKRNAIQYQSVCPVAVNAILDNHYVDDYLDSFDTLQDAEECINDVASIQNEAGFEIRNWVSNEQLLIKYLNKTKGNEENVDLLTNEGITEKTLGLEWNTKKDLLTFGFDSKNIPTEILEGQRKPTKREMLRIIMSIFDPLGIILPFIIRSKILFQDIWRSGINWDEQLKDSDFINWRGWIINLNQMGNYEIPRSFTKNHGPSINTELHIFTDASDKAYSSVAYLRTEHTCGKGKIHLISFIAGKARVAPLKPVSIPRMELQGALLGSRLGDSILKEIKMRINKRIFWSDSRTVLAWIHADPRKYQSFVAHRLGEIDELTNPEEWRWIPTKENPADCATRDKTNIITIMNKWLHGPNFLSLEENEWPKQLERNHNAEPTIEIKKEFLGMIKKTNEFETPNILRFSKWLRLIRVMGLILKTAQIWQRKKTRELTYEDLKSGEIYLIKKAQQECFPQEIQALKNKRPIPTNSRLKNQTLFISEHGVIKIQGRINLAEETIESKKNPIVLDGKHHLTHLLIQHYHERFQHGNTETVVNELKQSYWILKIRPTTKSIISKCSMCRLLWKKAEQPRMGDLPAARLAHHCRPFSYCGIDYFGPLLVTIGRRREKRWGALFTCLTTRAVHLELTSSLSTDSAIMALQRMSNRRGTPLEIFSDNGTNFVGANTELKKAIKEIDLTKFNEMVTNMGIQWKFIPPLTPHMGGSWERLVRSVKKSLAVILKERAPKEEILRTVLTEAEHTVNSRPLTKVSTDPHDPEAITPNHWLLGSSSGTIPWGEFRSEDLWCKKQWRTAQKLADMFWGRWLKEYLPELIVRKCWNHDVRNLAVGDVVLIVDSTTPRNNWPRGKITKTYPGKDNRVRVVDVLCRGKNMKRAANKIVVLVPSDLGTEGLTPRTVGENVGDENTIPCENPSMEGDKEKEEEGEARLEKSVEKGLQVSDP
ncbi:uncharacterized protein LOC122505403 [Leptopilina heterotoma]|uniref:uncharacterized protein LOC122505403 n=1 Tax=Leptopilina heterotoma TaxID=63436 RepID=UPI001CA93DC8|nr:uncharacterized protein LOC122505403 [Leptopilina heterotoma]